MRILVVGGGGREHALAWKLVQSDQVTELISAPGSPGMASLGETVDTKVDDLEGLARLAEERKIDLTVVGPEVPLVAGIADVFAERGLKVFGPSKAAAQIEGSKVYCRDIAERYGVPMARGGGFSDPRAAVEFSSSFEGPRVVKASGLAAGKGVLICGTHYEAQMAIEEIMHGRMFGASGDAIVVEEYLEGREISMFALTDGSTHLVLELAQDYKRALDDDEGLNTGGMGAYSPVPWLTPERRQDAVDRILLPLIEGLASEGHIFRGHFYAGLMFTDAGPRLIEVNCRFGDPETQALMPRLESDLAVLLDVCASGNLAGQTVEWSSDACVSVVVASGGYPESYDTGIEIDGIDHAEGTDGVTVFHAGTATERGRLVTAGGRVFNVSATAPTIAEARERAYEAVGKIRMHGKHARTDIAKGIE
jgi:phosphoribosylamine---glycine ligase